MNKYPLNKNGKPVEPHKTVSVIKRKVSRKTLIQIDATGLKKKEIQRLVEILNQNEIPHSISTKQYEPELQMQSFSDFKKMWEFAGEPGGFARATLMNALKHRSTEEGIFSPAHITVEKDGWECTFVRMYLLKHTEWFVNPDAYDTGIIRPIRKK